MVINIFKFFYILNISINIYNVVTLVKKITFVWIHFLKSINDDIIYNTLRQTTDK